MPNPLMHICYSYAIIAKNFVILAKFYKMDILILNFSQHGLPRNAIVIKNFGILVSFRRNLPVMFISAQTPGRSLQDGTVELPFVCSPALRYELIKLA